jgi:hypothetical protein
VQHLLLLHGHTHNGEAGAHHVLCGAGLCRHGGRKQPLQCCRISVNRNPLQPLLH